MLFIYIYIYVLHTYHNVATCAHLKHGRRRQGPEEAAEDS